MSLASLKFVNVLICFVHAYRYIYHAIFSENLLYNITATFIVNTYRYNYCIILVDYVLVLCNLIPIHLWYNLSSECIVHSYMYMYI